MRILAGRLGCDIVCVMAYWYGAETLLCVGEPTGMPHLFLRRPH